MMRERERNITVSELRQPTYAPLTPHHHRLPAFPSLSECALMKVFTVKLIHGIGTSSIMEILKTFSICIREECQKMQSACCCGVSYFHFFFIWQIQDSERDKDTNLILSLLQRHTFSVIDNVNRLLGACVTWCVCPWWLGGFRHLLGGPTVWPLSNVP